MEVKAMKCPVCDALLEVQEGAEFVTCKYCSSKLFVEDNNLERIKAKVRMKEIEHETARAKMAFDDKADARRKKMEEKKNENRSTIGLILGLFIIPILIIGGMYLSHGMKTKSLEKTVAEIQKDISNENFDDARVKVESLRDSDFSSDDKKRWNQTRKQLIKQIDDAEKAAILEKSIVVPAASSKIKGMNYNDVVELFENAGFTNINAIESTDKAGLFHDAGDVKEISIGGDKRFKESDVFLPDSLVTIYYYAE